MFWSIFMIFSLIGLSAGYDLTILHSNDVHARFQQFNKYGSDCSNEDAKDGKCFGGVARRFTKIKEVRASHDNVLLLDAGDQFMGTTWFTVYSGMATAFVMNILSYDAMCLGNHEFDLGVGPLVTFLDNVTFPVLSVNTNIKNEPRLNGKFLQSVEKTVGGETVAIIGYITTETPQISKPGPTVSFDDIITAIRQEVLVLQSKGINKIIALGHAGFDIDKQVAGIDGIDLVVGGHTNTFLYNGDQPSGEEIEGPYPVVADQPGGGKGLVVQAYTMGKYLGYLNLTFDDNGVLTKYSGNPILLDSSIQEDPGLASSIQEWKKPVDDIATEIIGFSNVLLDGDCYSKDCNLGNLVVDAIVDYHVNFSHPASRWAPASIAFWNSGGIRSSIDKGVITAGEAMSVMPFGNEIDVITVTGKNIRDQLELSVKDWSLGGGSSRFLQMSGLRVVYNTNNRAGERVVDVKTLCLDCEVPSYKALEDNAEYRIFLSTFLLNGGDGYSFIPLQRERFNSLDVTVVMDYIKKYKPSFPASDGRIQFTTSTTSSSASSRHHINVTIILYMLFNFIKMSF